MELDLADYSDVVDLTRVTLLKFDSQGLADGLNTFYMDNVAFVSTAPAPVEGLVVDFNDPSEWPADFAFEEDGICHGCRCRRC